MCVEGRCARKGVVSGLCVVASKARGLRGGWIERKRVTSPPLHGDLSMDGEGRRRRRRRIAWRGSALNGREFFGRKKGRAGRGKRTRSELWRVLDGLGGGCVTRDFGLIGLALGRGIGRVWWTGAVHNHVKWDECKFSCCEG